MIKRITPNLRILAAATGIIILLAAIKFMADGPYRNQLPAYPDFTTLSKPIQEQVSAAGRNVIFFTTAGTIGKLGMTYHSFSDYERAVKCYQLAIKKNKDAWIWNYYLGYLNLEQGQANAAIASFKEVTKKNPGNYSALYYTGEAYQKLGLKDSAEIMFTLVINAPDQAREKPSERESFFPLKTYAMFQLSRLYLSDGKPDSAEKVLKVIITDETAFGPAYRSLGVIYKDAGNKYLAGKYTERANDLADYIPPADIEMDKLALLSRSDQYLLKQIEDALRSSNYHWALTLCNQALQYYPDNKELISDAVYENFRQRLDNKALSYLDKHFACFSNDARELMDVTDVLYNHQHYPEAIKYFNQVKKLMPKNPDLATWLFERGKKDEAIAMMAALLKQNPTDDKILADEIRLLLNIGEDESANEYFARLTKYDPEGAETFRIKGLLAEKKGKVDSAGLAYEAAYKIAPTDLIFTRSLIDFYIRQKNWPQSISHFKAALALFPNEPFLQEGIGRLLISCPETALRNVKEGIEYTERAFINYRSPSDTRLLAGKTLATVYLSLGDKRNCTRYINKTIQAAAQVNQSEEYIAYFRALISK